jgi:hypothetical protein
MTKKIAKSPERYTFQKDSYLERCANKGVEPDADYLAVLDNISKQNEEWDTQEHQHNLEYDLRTTEWLIDKVRSNVSYAQNIYAALCNNEFQKLDTWPILKDEHWGCSWRHAGGIVANMRGQGDYIDWYCSGMGDGLGNGDRDKSKRYVAEGVVTDDVRADLLELGWKVKENTDK